jgi:uncharacterized protein with HEPN domain
MSKRGDFELVCDIKEALGRIGGYIAGLSFDEFLKDVKTQDAVVRNLEVVGEAAKNLSEDFKAAHHLIPWKKLAGVRDRLIHHYFGVNFDIVWNIAKEDLPELMAQFEKISFPK